MKQHRARSTVLTCLLTFLVLSMLATNAFAAPVVFAPKQHTINTANDTWSQISGTKMVWVSLASGQPEVMFDDLADASLPWALTNDAATESECYISGNRAVWTSSLGGDPEIWYDADVTDHLQNAVALTANTAVDHLPRIWGTRVAWQCNAGGDYEIWFDDLSDAVPAAAFTSNTSTDAFPVISGSRIVWQHNDATDIEIYMYDLADPGAGQVALTNNAFVDVNPDISGDRVVWNSDIAQLGGLESFEILHMNVSTDTTPTRLTTNAYDDGSVTVSGSRLVWHAQMGGSDYEIMYDDISDVTPPLQVTSNVADDSGPVISDARFVWESRESSTTDWEIYRDDLAADNGYPVNTAPDASNVIAAGYKNTLIPIAYAGLDPDGDSLSYFKTTSPAHGSLMGFGSTVYYTPATDYTGLDTFTYQAIDSELQSRVATVTISVTAPGPVAQSFSLVLSEDTTAAVTLLGSDSGGGSLGYQIQRNPTHGNVVPEVILGSGHWRYTPHANYNGTDVFCYMARNSQLVWSNVATVTLTINPVNDAPVASEDSATTGFGAPVSVSVTANDSDIESDPLSVTSVTDPPHGTAAITGPGTVLYTPDAQFSGSDVFTYQCSDGSDGSNPATVSVSVAAPPAPVSHPATVTIPAANVSLGFASLTETGTSSAIPSSGHPAGAGYTLIAGTYLDISTTATYTGDVIVTIPYDPANIGGVSESSLRLFHWEGGAWVDITLSVDAVSNTVTGRTTAFSPFVIMGPGAPAVVSTPASSPWSLALVAVSAMAVLITRRRPIRG